MPVWLKNLQRLVQFNEHLLRLHSTFLLHVAGAGRFDLSVVCMAEGEIRHLNKMYRNVDEATDVLAFPYHETIDVWERDALVLRRHTPGNEPTMEYDYNLGDIILCPSVIADQMVGGVKTPRLQYQLPIIVTHGLCHLLGFQHDTPTQWKQMYAKELSLLTLFNNTFGTCLRPLSTPETH